MSVGTGKGDALLTAFSADLSKISSPLLAITSASITVPSDINLTRTVHFKPSVAETGRIQLLFTFCLIANFACSDSLACAALLAAAASAAIFACASAAAFSAASAWAFASASDFAFASTSALAFAAASALAFASASALALAVASALAFASAYVQ